MEKAEVTTKKRDGDGKRGKVVNGRMNELRDSKECEQKCEIGRAHV